MSLDVLSILEAAYLHADNDEQWLHGVLRAVAPALDRGKGAVGARYERSADGMMRYSSIVASSKPAMHFAKIAGQLELEPGADVLTKKLFLAPPPFATASQKTGLGAGWPKHPAVAKTHVKIGVRDVIGLITADPSGAGCAILVPLGRVWSPPPEMVSLWSNVAAHLAAGLRLRTGTPGRKSTPDAVVTPSGTVTHAEGRAKSKEAIANIGRGVRAMERARGPLRKKAPGEAVALWRGLVDGRWSLLDYFDHDGRRYVVARPNEPPTPAWKALTERERQVAAYAALGHTNKLIAYELGLSTSTVAMHLSRAASKLGVRSRLALIQAYNAHLKHAEARRRR